MGKKSGLKKFLIPNRFWVKTIRVKENLVLEKNFVSKNYLGSKIFWVQRNFGSTNVFGLKEIFGQKMFSLKQLDPKEFLYLKKLKGNKT